MRHSSFHAVIGITAELVPGSATLPGESWNRFSFCWDTFRFRPLNAILAANKEFDQL